MSLKEGLMASLKNRLGSIKLEGQYRYLKKPVFATFKALNSAKRATRFSYGRIILPKIVSDKYKFVYIPNPLVLSSSMNHTFVKRPREDYGARIDYTDLENDYDAYKDYFKFSFVRNPLTRTVSCFNKKILNANSLGKLYIISRYRGLSPEMSFEEFVNWLLSKEGSDENADRHWVSQHKLLFTKEGNEICDYVGKFENFKKDFKNICEYVGIKEVEPYHVASSNKMMKKPLFKHYKEYYNEDLINKVYRRYYEDFEAFGYESDLD